MLFHWYSRYLYKVVISGSLSGGSPILTSRPIWFKSWVGWLFWIKFSFESKQGSQSNTEYNYNDTYLISLNKFKPQRFKPSDCIERHGLENVSFWQTLIRVIKFTMHRFSNLHVTIVSVEVNISIYW